METTMNQFLLPSAQLSPKELEKQCHLMKIFPDISFASQTPLPTPLRPLVIQVMFHLTLVLVPLLPRINFVPDAITENDYHHDLLITKTKSMISFPLFLVSPHGHQIKQQQ